MEQHNRDPGEEHMTSVFKSDDIQRCLQKLEAAGPLRMSPNMHQDDQTQNLRKTWAWMSSHNTYSAWMNNEYSQLLRVVGSSNSQRTRISECLIETFRKKAGESPEPSLACFFCEKQDRGGDAQVAILRSLVFQLLLQRSWLYRYIRDDFEKGADGTYFDDHLSDSQGLWRNFSDMIQDERGGPVYIVLDALDTCSGPRRSDLLRSIKELFDWFSSRSGGKLKLLVTYESNSIGIDDELGHVGVALDLDEENLGINLAENMLSGFERSFTSTDHDSFLKGSDRAKYTSTVELLFIRGASTDSKDNRYGRSPLSWAAESGQEDIVKRLLNKGVDIECTDKLGQTPISFAAEKGHEAIIKLLVDSGGHINTKDGNGWTPLLRAAKRGHLPVVKFLLRNGARVDHKSKNGHTPVSVAAENGHSAIVHVLLVNGAAVDSADCAYGRTPLSRTAENGHDGICQMLCERGAEVDSRDIHQQTPLVWASRNGHNRCVELLLRNGAATNVRDGRYGQTPLIWACRQGNESVAKLLFDNRADIDLSDNGGRTPLSWAAGNGESGVANFLLDRGAEVNSSDENGRTALSWAAGNGQTVSVRQLLDHDAECNVRDRHGRTPLSWALENAYGTIVTMLRNESCKY